MNEADLESFPPPRSRASTEHVFQLSGGGGSWGGARRLVDEVGPDRVTLLFADTKIEDEDLYRFLDDASRDLGIPVTRLADGRTPWQVFRDVSYIGNSRIDPCSRILKRELLWGWMEKHCDPETTTVCLGIDWTEENRLRRVRTYRPEWNVRAPLCEEPYITKADVLEQMVERGIEPPRLYGMGFAHNNCGGFCVKAGQAPFRLLAQKFPERYAEHEHAEEQMREVLGDVSILRDRTLAARAAAVGATEDDLMKYGKHHVVAATGRRIPGVVPLSLREFRERLLAGGEIDEFDWGGCGCALD